MKKVWYEDLTPGMPPEGSLQVEARGEGDWEFVFPRLTLTIYEYFHDAIESWEVGDVTFAEQRYRQLLTDYPEFIDAYHHLAILLEETGDEDEAYKLWQHAVRIGEEHLPDPVRAGKGRLPWLMIDNRPFLRACHGLGLELRERGEIDEALAIFMRLLDWNPNDNQGIRDLVVRCHFLIDQPDGVLEVCERYPDDGMETLLYGRALALIQLGEARKAREALELAVEHLPLVAQELVKERHRAPKDFDPDHITLWSPGQAYHYWLEQGHHWKRTEGALELLREVLEGMEG
ncbi:MAG: hypothetical protein P1P76_06335 [Anaerolineales bacterium]|nr:hypothetical protein [Anaerolineales bacterium]